MNPIRLGVSGCCGRMGRSVLRLAAGKPDLRVCAALTSPRSAGLGRDAGVVAGVADLGVAIASSAADGACDVLIDFTTASACAAWAEWARSHRTGFVSGTTGLGPDQLATLRRAADEIPVLWSANMSLGVALLRALLRQAAAALDPQEWDAEIVESHHRHKRDAPSGTAQALLGAVLAGRTGQTEEASAQAHEHPEQVRFGRDAQSPPRKAGEIGVHALRLGGVVGEHEVRFASEGEELSLGHRAFSRDVFAAGALRAARWLAGRPAGWYTLDDVLTPHG